MFQIVGAVAFLAYAAGQLPAAIWMGKPWAVAWKEVFDGLLYGLVTAGTFRVALAEVTCVSAVSGER